MLNRKSHAGLPDTGSSKETVQLELPLDEEVPLVLPSEEDPVVCPCVTSSESSPATAQARHRSASVHRATTG